MTADVPEAPRLQRWLNRWLSKVYVTSTIVGAPSVAELETPRAELIGVQPLVAKPRRKGLGPKQLRWLRSNIEPFKDMEARAIAAKGGGKAGK
jgi:hypothetical protein